MKIESTPMLEAIRNDCRLGITVLKSELNDTFNMDSEEKMKKAQEKIEEQIKYRNEIIDACNHDLTEISRGSLKKVR